MTFEDIERTNGFITDTRKRVPVEALRFKLQALVADDEGHILCGADMFIMRPTEFMPVVSMALNGTQLKAMRS